RPGEVLALEADRDRRITARAHVVRRDVHLHAPAPRPGEEQAACPPEELPARPRAGVCVPLDAQGCLRGEAGPVPASDRVGSSTRMATLFTAQPGRLETFLRGVPLFADLEPAALAALAKDAQVVSYPVGETIIREGDAADALYVIVKGAVRAVTAPD